MLFCYLNAALAVIYTLVLGSSSFLLVLVLLAVAAYGIANERRWGYWGAVVLSCLYLVGQVALLATGGSLGGVLDLLFAAILVVLLLHPESRTYQRAFFH